MTQHTTASRGRATRLTGQFPQVVAGALCQRLKDIGEVVGHVLRHRMVISEGAPGPGESVLAELPRCFVFAQ